MDKSKIETRFYELKDMKLEEREDKSPRLVGYAVRYNALSQDLGGFKERFLPHSFARSLENGPDILALIQHDMTKVMGRRSSGTLQAEDDAFGVKVKIDPPNTSFSLDIQESVRRKDVVGMSFAFESIEEEMVREGDGWVREVRDADLYEVSIVTNPAYLQSKIKIRSEVIEKLEELNKPVEYRKSMETLLKFQRQAEAEIKLL